MKLIQSSVVSVLFVGTSAFAFDNIKTSGDARFYYYADDTGKGLFNKDTARGQATVGLGLSADIQEGVKANANLTVLSTLGLQGQLISKGWETTNATDDSYWMDTLNISADFGKTNTTVGRMTLDTPLLWTETWSAAYNTFEAAVVKNNDLADTTIIAAYIGGSNGAIENGDPGWVIANMNKKGNTNFSKFHDGAYIGGIINKSLKSLTLQAWYYNVRSYLSDVWVQADYEMNGIILGAQYTGGTNMSGSSKSKTNAYALKLGYAMKDTFSLTASYSQTGHNKSAGGKDLSAKNLSGEGYTKLYTESYWTAIAGSQDMQTINITANAPVADLFDFSIYFVDASDTSKNRLIETTFELAKSYGNLDTTLVYAHRTPKGTLKTSDPAKAVVLASLKYNF